MPLTDPELFAALQSIALAAFDSSEWQAVLDWMTRAAGGEFSQLLGLHPVLGFQFNLATAIPGELSAEFEARGGGDPRINPRARVLNRQEFLVHTDAMLATPDELRKSEFMQDLAYRIGSADLCNARLPAVQGVTIAAAVSGGKPFGDAERGSFARLLPAIHKAFRLRAALDRQSAALAAGALDAVSSAALVVDGQQNVLAMTREAERMLETQGLIRLAGSRVEALDPMSNRALQKALFLACTKKDALQQPSASTIALRDAGGDVTVAEVAPLPARAFDLRFGPSAVVAFVRPRRMDNPGHILRQSFDLTPAECEVALALLRGMAPAGIAAARRVSVETVRSQVKAIFLKLGVDSRAAFMRRLAHLIPPP